MPANEYYDSTGAPGNKAALSSATIRAEFDSIESGFNKLPVLAGNGSLPVFINATGSQIEAISATAAKTALALGNVDNTSDATKNAAVATLTNKTLTAPVINSPTGIVKGDVGLGNVDNTSDATKNAAVATLTNKTLTSPIINGSDIDDAYITNTYLAYGMHLGTPDDGILSNCTNASSTAKGVVELAIASEINTGTDTTRAITPDALAGSVLGTKNIIIKCLQDTTNLTVGDGISHIAIPSEFNGMNLVSAGAHVYTASSSGTPTFQIHNQTDAHDMLSTRITIDAGEYDSSTAVTPAVADTTYDDVATGDVLRFDCDVAGTGTAGMEIRVGFRLP
jgi:phosphoribosylformylglycinamidine (FGAM) synthase PurS component